MKMMNLYIWGLFFISCGNKMGIDQGRIEIQAYLNEKYNYLFIIEKIEKGYNPDLFKEQWGFKVWLSDTSQIKFGPISFEKSEYQNGWITYGGYDLDMEYQKAKVEIYLNSSSGFR